MTRSTVPAAVVLLAGVCAARAAELDCAANAGLLDTHFARYGPAPARTITREAQAVRFRLPAAANAGGQAGLYSYFALAGDFEVTATYDWTSVAPPQGGYGVSCGIAVDAQGPGGSVALARGQLRGQPGGYLVTRGLPSESGTRYETTHYATRAKGGRLALRREKAELVCLAADGPKEPLRQLCRVPFTEGTVRPLRVFADQGGRRPPWTPGWARSASVPRRSRAAPPGGRPAAGRVGGWQ